MKKIPFLRSIRVKILLILSLMLLLLIGYFYVYNIYDNNQLQNIIEQITKEKSSTLSKLIDLKGKPLEIVVDNEYTQWDEMVSYIHKPTAAFEESALGILYDSYGYSAVWIYDDKFNLVYKKSYELSDSLVNKGVPGDFQAMQKQLLNENLMHFFTITPMGVLEIRGASVVYTNDPNRKGKAEGYFVASYLWDKAYLAELNKLADANISIDYNYSEDSFKKKPHSKGEGNITIYYPFKNIHQKTIAHLKVEFSNVTIQYITDSQTNRGIIFVVFSLFLIIIISWMLFRWIITPLMAISDSLTELDPKYLDRIRKDKGEFGQLTALIDDSFKQKAILENEIGIRRETEIELLKARNAADLANKAKSDFLATMSHEIRTPMNGVIGMTSLLIQTKLDDEQRDFVDTIRLSGDNLLNIINDILDFSKIESGKLELEEHTFDLRTTIEEVFDLLAPRTVDKKLELLVWVDQNIPEYILGDVSRLRQVLVNLVGNSIKFTEEGEITVYVKESEKKGEDIILSFSVKDTGIGIPKEKIPGLLTPFTQVDASTARKYGGTGLGLAISSKLVELMGGKINIESIENEGSIFYFSIKTQYKHLPKPKEDLMSSHPFFLGKKVLIVDDNSANRKILSMHCKNWHLTPMEAKDGPEALRILDKNKFDLGILDMQMPGMDGITLAREIRKTKNKEELPLIMLTSLGYKDPATDLDTLFDHYVGKPIKQSELFNLITTVFSKIKPQTFKSSKAQETIEILSDKYPLNILIAEDNVINQKLIVKVFQLMGFKPDIAANGFEVLDALNRQHYDMVFMDIQMPEMDGFEATVKIIEKFGSTRPVIIAITANAMQGDREICLEAGMDDYISKPIKIEEVQRVIHHFGDLRHK